jgi:hypothetical protein
MRRNVPGPLAQRILFRAETKEESAATIAQRLGLRISAVLKVLDDRQKCPTRVQETTRVKVTSIRQEMHEGNGLGNFPKTQSRKRRKTK